MRPLSFAVLLFVSCLCFGLSQRAVAFPGTTGGWSPITGEVRLGFNRRVLAVADWSNSKEADLITVDENNTVTLNSWSSDSNVFFESWRFEFGDEGIISAAVADLNRDGHVDMALITTQGKLHIIYGPNRLAYDVMPNIPLHTSLPHLNVLTLYGTCAVPDLVVLTAAGYLTVLRNTIANGGRGCDNIGGNATFVAESNVTLSDSIASLALKVAAVDFDGNCQSEYLGPLGQSDDTTTYMAVSDVPGAAPVQTFTVPAFFGVPSYGDIDGDGALDIVYPACTAPEWVSSFDTYVCSAYNAVAILRNTISGAVCGSESCCEGHGSRFASVSYTAADGYKATGGSFSLSPFNCQTQSPFVEGGADNLPDAEMLDLPLYPAVIRLFDYNRDTHTDMVIATSWGPMVLTNQGGGTSLVCNALDIVTARESEAFRSSIPFPFDISEDGTLDIITFPTNMTRNGTVLVYWNGFSMDENYFFTATMLNGVEGGGYPFWGAVQTGGVHRFQWQDVDTHTRTGTVTQYTSSSAHMLLLPHAHFGLGRTFSPIQNYGTGVRNGGGDHYRDWTAYLMPNSQVVVLANPITDPSQWTLRLFLYALQYKRIILIALPTVLAVIGLPIFVLKCQEMKVDRAEKRQQMS